MYDFFWLSPADQGDLSDVVRASLQSPPPPPLPPHHHHRLPAAPATPAPTVCSLLLQGRVNFGGDDHDEVHSQQQLVHGNNGGMAGFMPAGSNAALCPQHHPEAEGLMMVIPQPPMSGPQPQLPASSSFVERDGDAPAFSLEEHAVLDMAMAPLPCHATAIKRRKSQTKKVVCIPAPVAAPPVPGPVVGLGGRPSTSGGEVVPSDLWAWRKYGQKPIKGSPYPRGYYRCSSSKGCSARKQVERSRTDPSMLVITYTSDHNHPWPTQRNALAGSTRPPLASSATRAHHHQRHSAVPDTTTTTPAQAHHRHASSNVAVADNATPAGSISIIDHLKQEVVDMDNPRQQPGMEDDDAADHDLLGMFADMDGALCGSDLHLHPKKQQQHATAQGLEEEKLPEEEEDKQSLLGLGPDPFSFSFLDWVGASFGVGETTAADNAGAHS